MNNDRGVDSPPSYSVKKNIFNICMEIAETNKLSKYFKHNIDLHIRKYGESFVKSYLYNNKEKLNERLNYKESLFREDMYYRLNYLNKIIESELPFYKLPKKEILEKYDMYTKDIEREWKRKEKKRRKRSFDELNSLVDVVLAKK